MENLKALVYKGDLTPYQRALARREFEGMVERLEIYEKAVNNNAVLPHVSGSLPTSKELEEIVVKIAYSQQGGEQSDDCYAKMGMLHEFISKYVNGNDR